MRTRIKARRTEIGWAAAVSLVVAIGSIYLLSRDQPASSHAAVSLVMAVASLGVAALATRTGHPRVAYFAAASLSFPALRLAGLLFRDVFDPERWPDGAIYLRWDPAAVPGVAVLIVLSTILAILATYGIGPVQFPARRRAPDDEDWRSIFRGRPPGPEDDPTWRPTPPTR